MKTPTPPIDIAIIGMSALFPRAKGLQAYWQNILNKVKAIEEAPDAWAKPYFDPNSQENDRLYTRKGGFLGDLAEFNPLEFGIMPNSVDGGEPDHFLALKLCWEALKDANYLERPFNREKTGIIIGRGTYINRGYNTLLQHGQIVDQTLNVIQQLLPELETETLSEVRQQLKATLPPFTAEMAPGLVPNVITGRIANRLDLKGPNYIVDAACASSLISIDLAIKELQSGRCDMVLAGGVHASTPPQINMIFCQLGALSRGDLSPFGQSAEGTLLGEGLGILVLKRLEDAEKEGDRIYAVVKGVGISSDGKALGLLAPRLEGELVALDRAYAASGVDPQTLGLIEAHGTGIPLGDKTEIQSLTHQFGQYDGILPQCAIGSVKSMIGHCIPAAGAASLIKTVLALYHKILPPTLCDQINPDLEIDKTPFYLNTEARPWIHGRSDSPRRAGINAFGFGGINAHVVVEEYVKPSAQPSRQLHSQWTSELLVFAAESQQALVAKIQRVERFLLTHPQTSLAELAQTLDAEGQAGEIRLVIVAKDLADAQAKLKRSLEQLASNQRNKWQTRNGIYYAQNGNLAAAEKTALIFPGEGSQYANMLADLCLYFPQVRAWFDFLDATFGDQRQVPPSTFIFPPPDLSLNEGQRRLAQEELFNMDLASETVFTANMALHELLQQFGVKAAAIVGHSTGENAALIASQTLKLENREQLGAAMRHLNQIYRDLVAQDKIAKGALLTVGACDRQVLQQLLDQFAGRLYLAMNNCPNQAILFGSPSDIEEVMAIIQQQGGICARLPFDRAYHTPLFTEVSQAFRAFYDSLEVGAGETPLYSCLTAQAFADDPETIRALAANQWSNEVKFWETIETLYQEGIRTFIEVGPSSNLTGFVDDILRSREYLALASNNPRKLGLEQLQTLLACLFVNGAKLNFAPLYQERMLSAIDLDQPAAPQTPKAPGSQILDLTMPVMQLSPEFAQKIRNKLGKQVPPPVVEREASPAQPTHASEPPLAPPDPSPSPAPQPVAATLPSPFSTNQPQPITPAAQASKEMAAQMSLSVWEPQPSAIADSELPVLLSDVPIAQEPVVAGSDRLSLLYQHFELMQEFLATQARIAGDVYRVPNAYSPPLDTHLNQQGDLSSISASPHPPVPASALSNDLQANWYGPVAPQPTPFPLLGQILKHDGQSLSCERLFSLETDLFLHDHTLGGQLSELHPELIPLPVIPFTVSMEMLAEAALYLVGGDRTVIGIEDIRGYRWLSLDRGAIALGSEAQLLSATPAESQVQVRLFQNSNSETVNRHLVFEGTVKLAPQFPAAPPPLPFTLENSAPSRWSDEQLYRTGMFHGPRFQGVKHIRGWDLQGIEADLQVIPVDDFFQGCPQPIFQVDSGLLDAAGQLVGYWVSEQFGTDFNVFPFRVTAFYQYEPPLPPGSYVICRGVMGFVSELQTEASFDFLDQSGRVIARLEGWQDRYFSVPHKYYQCRLHPQTSYLSEAWQQGETGLICRRINPLPEGFLDDSWSIWKRVLAHLTLNAVERDVWYSLPEEGSHRTDWLLGRIAAKDAIRQWIEQTLQMTLAPVDVEILDDEWGNPVIRCPELEAYTLLPKVYITHSEGAAIATLDF
jgi:acyl transferase domain-containing protein